MENSSEISVVQVIVKESLRVPAFFLQGKIQGCKINGHAPKMLWFENWNIIENRFIINTYVSRQSSFISAIIFTTFFFISYVLFIQKGSGQYSKELCRVWEPFPSINYGFVKVIKN